MTSAKGSHLYGNGHNQVKVLNIYEGVCEIIPSGLGEVFKSLEGFTVWKANLKTVSSEDLKQFPHLKEIWLYVNQLEYLEPNLFKYNPKLENINLNNNKINYIGSNYFNDLARLSSMNFHSNNCINQVVKNAAELEEVRKEIKTKCPSKEEATEKKATEELLELTDFSDVVLVRKHIEILQITIVELRREIIILKERNACVLKLL